MKFLQEKYSNIPIILRKVNYQVSQMIWMTSINLNLLNKTILISLRLNNVKRNRNTRIFIEYNREWKQ